MKKTLILLAHPNIQESRLNKAMLDAIIDVPHITVHDLYAHYRSAEFIDVKKEQALLLAHDRIVFQFPLFWFSTPGLLKDWQDKVFERGFSHGSGGDKLAGKEFKIATTLGSPQYAYQAGAYMQSSISEILKPLQTTALYTQMIFTPTFAIYQALKITDEALQEEALKYKDILSRDDWSDSLIKERSDKINS